MAVTRRFLRLRVALQELGARLQNDVDLDDDKSDEEQSDCNNGRVRAGISRARDAIRTDRTFTIASSAVRAQNAFTVLFADNVTSNTSLAVLS